MKKYFLLAFACFSLFACSRKTVPQKGTNGTIVNGNNVSANNNNTVSSNNSTTLNNTNTISTPLADTTSSVNNINTVDFLVVSSAYGKIVTQQDSLPQDANVQYNQFELSKGFSPQ